MTRKETIKDDFNITDERLQVNFYLNNNGEKEKMKELAKHHGLSASALLRMLILKEWRAEVKDSGH